MKETNKIYDSLTAFGICLLTIPTAFLIPGIQIESIFNSSIISDYISEYLLNAGFLA